MPDTSVPIPDKTVPKVAPGPGTDAPAAKLAPSSMGENRASYLLNAGVKNTAGETVGSINDMLFDSSGKISHVIVGVGGFLGIGERNVALAFDQVQLSRDSSNRLTATAKISRESLNTAPEWKDPNAAAAERSSPTSPGSSSPTKPKIQ
jgi:sporulation protein YlmC with PRC-barrel domain